MNIDESLKCPNCNGIHFEVKREATYLYTYKIDPPNSGTNGDDDSLPFLFDNREKIGGKEYLECKKCGSKYRCDLDELSNKIHFTILQKAIRSDNQVNPQFLG